MCLLLFFFCCIYCSVTVFLFYSSFLMLGERESHYRTHEGYPPGGILGTLIQSKRSYYLRGNYYLNTPTFPTDKITSPLCEVLPQPFDTDICCLWSRAVSKRNAKKISSSIKLLSIQIRNDNTLSQSRVQKNGN